MHYQYPPEADSHQDLPRKKSNGMNRSKDRSRRMPMVALRCDKERGCMSRDEVELWPRHEHV
jgi:hypothetical protein